MEFTRESFIEFRKHMENKHAYHSIMSEIYNRLENDPDCNIFGYRTNTNKDYSDLIAALNELKIKATINPTQGIIEIDYSQYTNI